jgi:hypothetical protein
MTLEDFAAAVHEDYLAISENIATKDDLWPMQRDIRTLTAQLKEVREDVKHVTENMVSKADLANTPNEELAKSAYARQLNDLHRRVNVLEAKLGIKPADRAANN